MKVLLCTDGSELSMKGVRRAAKLATLVKEAEIHVVYVYQPLHIPASVGSSYAHVPIPHSIETEMKDHGKSVLNRASRVLQEFGANFTTHMLTGHPAATLIDFAEKEKVDLVIIGSKGRTGLQRVFMGSVSTAVVQQVHCDVLVVK
jgi:nucleotide-binding universal stress UspA family protein